MNEARVYSLLSGALVASGVAMFICVAYLRVSFPPQLIMVVAIPLVWSFARGVLARRASLRLPNDEDLDFKGAAPRWLWIAAPILALALLPGLIVTERGAPAVLPAGTAHEQSWSERDGRYFTRVNGGPEREIDREEYEAETRNVMKFLALGLVVFAFASLVLWQQEELLRNRERNES
jgi:FtsH-binding integral membrane protein